MLENSLVDSANLLSTTESVVQDIQSDLSLYPEIADLMAYLQIENAQEWADAISESSQESLTILNMLVNQSEADLFLKDIAEHFGAKFPRRKAINYLKNKLGALVLDALSRHSIPDNRYQISQLVTAFGSDLPEEIQQRLHLIQDQSSSAVIEYDHPLWYLCEESEGKLNTALNENKTILVDNHFLIKFEGTFVALCLESFKSASGDYFIEGLWYSPSDLETKNAIRAAFDAKQDRIFVPKGKWEAQRSLLYDLNGNELQVSSEVFLQTIKQKYQRTIQANKQFQSTTTNKAYRIFQRRDLNNQLLQHRAIRSP